MSTAEHIHLTRSFGTKNYAPVEVVVARGKGVWVWDVEDKKYLDMLSAYSAVNFGHGNERILNAAREQLDRVTLTSRAFFNDQLGPFCQELAELCGMEAVLPMNSGAEAVETAVKAVRKWGYEVKGVEPDKAELICFSNNFHGRTITIISFSDSATGRKNFGPFTPGFKIVPYGDAEALAAAVTKNTVGVLVEPIQGEAGILIPPDGYLKKVRQICDLNNMLMVADEIQTGLGRTGALFACDHEGVKPDIYIIGKSLGGSITPISAVIGMHKVMDVFVPGSHGSTFGGNSLACRVAREVIQIIKAELPFTRVKDLGSWFAGELKTMVGKSFSEVRGRGLLIGADIPPEKGKAKDYCKKLKEIGVLCKDTRERTIRFAPPLIITKEELQWGLDRIKQVFNDGK